MSDDSKADRVYRLVKGRTEYLYKESPPTRAMLAKLRRGVGKSISSCPEAWGILLEGLDEDLMSRKEGSSYAENAIWTALTLYALHQQGKQGQNMSNEDCPFGSAVGKLILPDGTNEQAVRRRFNSVITAKNPSEAAYHARGLVQLLRGKDISFSYPQFAKDLYTLQFEDSRNKVLLRWGEDSYKKQKVNTEQEKEPANG